MKKRFLTALVGLFIFVSISRGDGYIWFENVYYGGPVHYAQTNVPFGKEGQRIDSDFTASLYWTFGTVTEPTASEPTAIPIALNLHPDNQVFLPVNGLLGAGYFGTGWQHEYSHKLTLPGYTSGPVTLEVVAWASSGPYAGTNYASSRLRGHSAAFTLGEVASTNCGSLPYAFCATYLTWLNSFEVSFACQESPPQITQQPFDATIPAGSNATFSVTASSDLPFLAYQWRFNGMVIPGATSPTLLVSNVQPANSGNYSVVISSCGLTTSSNAFLTVDTIPVITSQPVGTVGYWGKNAQFRVTATGVPAPNYLWYREGIPIAWATNSTLNLANLEFTDAGHYWVVVSNSQGSVTSSSVLLVVNPAGVNIGLHPFLLIEGVVGRTYRIEYTSSVSDTSSWTTLTNLTLTQPFQDWTDVGVDTASAGIPKRFYRVIAVP